MVSHMLCDTKGKATILEGMEISLLYLVTSIFL